MIFRPSGSGLQRIRFGHFGDDGAVLACVKAFQCPHGPGRVWFN